MSHLLKAECYKLFHSRYVWGIGLLTFILSSLLLLDSRRTAPDLFLASLYNTPLLYFFVIVFAALYIGNDFGNRTLQLSIQAGHRRRAVVLSKVLAYQAGSMMILVTPLFLHGMTGLLFLHEPAGVIHRFTILTAATAIAAMCMLPFAFAFVIRETGKTLTISTVLFFCMIFLLNGEQAPSISQILPMGQLRLIALQHSSNLNIHFIAIDVGWIAVLYLSAYIWLIHSDLK